MARSSDHQIISSASSVKVNEEEVNEIQNLGRSKRLETQIMKIPKSYSCIRETTIQQTLAQQITINPSPSITFIVMQLKRKCNWKTKNFPSAKTQQNEIMRLTIKPPQPSAVLQSSAALRNPQSSEVSNPPQQPHPCTYKPLE